MIPKIASALARVLDPIRPIERPGQSISFNPSPDPNEGGHGAPGYEGEKEVPKSESESVEERLSEPMAEEGLPPEAREKPAAVPFRPGLTQVILDLNASRIERTSAVAAQTYEIGAKDQKRNARLPKGSMLDKKVG